MYEHHSKKGWTSRGRRRHETLSFAAGVRALRVPRPVSSNGGRAFHQYLRGSWGCSPVTCPSSWQNTTMFRRSFVKAALCKAFACIFQRGKIRLNELMDTLGIPDVRRAPCVQSPSRSHRFRPCVGSGPDRFRWYHPARRLRCPSRPSWRTSCCCRGRRSCGDPMPLLYARLLGRPRGWLGPK